MLESEKKPCARVTIRNRKGLHARASAKFVKCAEAFEATVRVTRDDRTVGGTSIMSLMALAAGPGTGLCWKPKARKARRPSRPWWRSWSPGSARSTERRKRGAVAGAPSLPPLIFSDVVGQFVSRSFEIFKAMSRKALLRPSPVDVS